MSKCPVCENEILADDDKWMLATEVPYLNMFLHKHCWNKVKDNLQLYIQKIVEKYLDLNNNTKK